MSSITHAPPTFLDPGDDDHHRAGHDRSVGVPNPTPTTPASAGDALAGAASGADRGPGRWGAGFVEPHLLFGRPAGEYLVWVFIVAGGAADLAAFYTVLSVAFRSNPFIVWLGTIGFTAVCVGLAHFIGVLKAMRLHGNRRYQPSLMAGLVASWIGLGLAAFVTRLAVSTPSTTAAVIGAGTGTAPTTGSTPPIVMGTLFLALFLASGMCAVWAGYLGHNPAVTAHRHAKVGYLHAADEVTAAEAALTHCQAVLNNKKATIESDQREHAAAVAEHRGWAFELLHLSRVLQAQTADSPATIEGLTTTGPIHTDTFTGLNGFTDPHPWAEPGNPSDTTSPTPLTP